MPSIVIHNRTSLFRGIIMTQQHSQHLIAGVNDKIPVGKSLILGL